MKRRGFLKNAAVSTFAVTPLVRRLASFTGQPTAIGHDIQHGPNYGRPFEPPTRPALLPLPPGAVEPRGWLRDWCITAKNGYTGHMDEFDPAFQQAWAADFTLRGEKLRLWDKGAWPLEGGGYWFDGLLKWVMPCTTNP